MKLQINNLSYAIIEDVEDVIQGIVKRMQNHSDWENVGNSTGIELAKEIIIKNNPNLIFMDWHIKGGSTYEILDIIASTSNYNPYIVYFTGYQKDEPEIPEVVFNKYEVDKYLIKPIWKKLSEYLPLYLDEAKQKALNNIKVNILDENHNIIRVNPKEITSIVQYDSARRTKSIRLINGDEIIVKQTFSDLEELLQYACLQYIYTNKRFSIVTKHHIEKLEHDFICFKKSNSPKVEIAKENLKIVKEWLLTS